ncbi:MAG: helix-turn-helix domain-containing protein [Candidatus Tokpelaia sp.]|uniref:helix-turn-helix domain-containing protein n=1 Tax=Candidatus Tokpelaia sp. TaxID=2233777 RepID=UPI00123AB93B|nr:helix-turn-helix domain-containing protein [Candidatus Tokpelaia sp.]KAA6204359.1 MAG: helix-turn-helix domain-containing protein [Candidatus Tokpelaia sp.]KAA6205345.1 MAG: helix-turn-helix domain-containing protein [Candidatus Tokpelaia sp.]KAA6405349.1 transcriptional regulator [Candidatus Tokpelaia sp.]
MSKTKKQPDPIDIYVGGRIRLQRNLKNMTQQQLGEQLGVTFQQIQKYEKGTNRVGASRLQAISEILEAPVSFFFSNPEEDGLFTMKKEGFAEEGSPPPDWQCSSAEGAQLIRAFTRIQDPQVRRKIIALTKVLAGGA